ncbi:MAG TPA: hypothetical protein VGD18_06235 [Thiobacillaceae bacterium]
MAALDLTAQPSDGISTSRHKLVTDSPGFRSPHPANPLRAPKTGANDATRALARAMQIAANRQQT